MFCEYFYERTICFSILWRFFERDAKCLIIDHLDRFFFSVWFYRNSDEHIEHNLFNERRSSGENRLLGGEIETNDLDHQGTIIVSLVIDGACFR